MDGGELPLQIPMAATVKTQHQAAEHESPSRMVNPDPFLEATHCCCAAVSWITTCCSALRESCTALYLQQGVRVELVEEVHDGVGVQRGGAHHHVLLALRAVRRVRAAQLLPLHPREGELLQLQIKSSVS